MGHGPGRMQRRVLEAVARDGEVWLVDLLEDGEPVGGSVYKSLWRAALALPPTDDPLRRVSARGCGDGYGQRLRPSGCWSRTTGSGSSSRSSVL